MNNVSLPIAIRDLNELVKFKYVEKVGTFRGAYYILSSNKKE
jgi:hypothetical protein